MFSRAAHAAVFAVYAAAVLLTSPAAAWSLSGKSSETTQGAQVLSSAGTAEHVQDHYWWNIKTGKFLKHPV